MNAPLGTFALALRSVPAAALAVLLFCYVMFADAARAQSMAWGTDISVNQACVKCNAAQGDLKVHSSGNALALWVQNDGVPDIAAARYDAATGSWRGFKTIYTGVYTGESRGVYQPKLAMDAQGNAVAVWVENISHTIYFARYRASDATWSAAGVAHVGSGFWFSDVNVGVDAQRNVFIHWKEGAGRQLMAKRYDAGSNTWSASLPVGNVGSVQHSDLAVDALGNAMIVWLQGSDYSVHYSRYAASTGQWSIPARAGQATQGSGIQLALHSNGNGMALWNTGANASNPYGRLSVIRFQAASNTWSAPRLLQASATHVNSPDMALDPSGNAFVAWGQTGDYSKPFKITAARYNTSTGQWSASQTISYGTQNDVFSRIATDGKGNAVVIWSRMTQFLENGDRLFRKASVRFSAASGSWGQVRTSSSEVLEAYPTGLGIDSSGNALAVYQQDSGYRWNGSIIYGMRSSRLSVSQ